MANNFSYDPDTGVITRLKGNFRNQPAFDSVQSAGYLQGSFEYQKFLAHRVAWVLYWGVWPDGEIDHENHDKHDNRISNLMLVSSQQNAQNKPITPRNTSGIKGVSWNRRDGKWQVIIGFNGKLHNMGQYKDIHEAERRAKWAYEFFGFHPNHGGLL